MKISHTRAAGIAVGGVGVDRQIEVASGIFGFVRTVGQESFLGGRGPRLRTWQDVVNAVTLQVGDHSGGNLPHIVFLAAAAVAIGIPRLGRRA